MERKEAHFVEGHPAQKTYHAAVEPVDETVYGDYTRVLMGIYAASGYYCLVKYVIETGALDTDWGDYGKWGYDGTIDSTVYSRYVTFTDDGRTLVGHSYVHLVEGDDFALLSMLDDDGVRDTTWGNNGFYIPDYDDEGLSSITTILTDNDGNFHVFGQARTTSKYCYIKISSAGVFISGVKASTMMSSSSTVTDAVWADDDKTRIIAAGYKNLVAIDPSTGAIDTTWGTNGKFTLTDTAQNIVRLSDGGIVTFHNDDDICNKVKADGSGLDTDWATNGVLTIDRTGYGTGNLRKLVADEDDNIYFAVKVKIDNVYNAVLTKVDSTGTVVDTEAIVTNSASRYDTIGFIDDNLYFYAGMTKDIEIWTTGFEYVTGYDLPNGLEDYVYYIFPDESTRTVISTATEGSDEYWTEEEIGYGHMEGETVAILADGVVQDEQEIVDGAIDETDFPDAEVHVGLKYKSKLQPMRPVTSPEMMASTVTVKKMGISVHNTDDITVGILDSDMKDVSFADMKNKSKIDGLYTGTVEVSVPDGYSKNCPLQIITDSPLPATIRAMIPKLDTTGGR